MIQLVFLVGCNSKNSLFNDKNYYQLNVISDESTFDDNRGTYSGGAYYNSIKINKEIFEPDDGCGFLIYKFVLNSKMDDATILNELFEINIKTETAYYTSEKVYMDSDGKTVYVCVDIPLQEFNKKEKNLRAIACVFDKNYRIDSTYLSYNDFYEKFESAIEISNKIYKLQFDTFKVYSESVTSGFSRAQLKILENTLKTELKSLEETFEKLKNFTYYQDIPETVLEDYKKWSNAVRKL